MNYMKLYMNMHLKNWVLYPLSILLYLPAYLFSMLVGFFLATIFVPELIAFFIAMLIGAFICSLPALYINHKIARNYICSYSNSESIAGLTIKNHAVSYIVYVIIFYSLQWLM